MSVPILILAGGSSSRMGSRQKLLEPVHGQPLLRVQACRALKASPHVTVLIRPDVPLVKQALNGLDVRILEAPQAHEGMSGSIRAGAHAHVNDPCFLMLLTDLIDIDTTDMRKVINARDAQTDHWIWRGATEDGKPGHPILFDQKVYDALLGIRGDTGAQEVIKANKNKVQLVPLPGRRARRDLDTPQDWDDWHAQNPTQSP
ncbi:MAG: nucleotidyltransferase family protein [Aliishimia sp.]